MDPSLAISNIRIESNYQNKSAVGALLSAAWPSLPAGFLVGLLTSLAVVFVFGVTPFDVISPPFFVGALLGSFLVNSALFF